MTPRPGDQGPEPPAAAGSSPPDDVVATAREVAAALLPLAYHPRLQRSWIATLAWAVRDSLAAERQTALSAPPRLRLARALAHAVRGLCEHDPVAASIADLRLFARLTLGECGDLLARPRDELARRWRASKRALFASARTALGPSAARNDEPDGAA